MKPGPLLLYILSFFWFQGFFESTAGLNKKGNKLFTEKKYESALEAYRDAQIRSPEQPEVRYNSGTTLYELDQFEEAEKQLTRSIETTKTNDLKARAWYNFANNQYRLGQFDKAIEAYKKALDFNPDDEDAKFNLELLQTKKKSFDMKQDARNQSRKDQPKNKDQKKQDQGGGGGSSKQNQPQDQQQGGGQGENDEQQNPSKGNEQQQPKDQEKEEESKSQSQSQSDPREQEEKRPEEGQQQEASPSQERKENKSEQQKQEGEEDRDQQKEHPQNQDGGNRPLYQGQMSKMDANRILDALRQSEQQLQLLKKPNKQSNREPIRDW
jgi:Ca-activated chloride channel homolog